MINYNGEIAIDLSNVKAIKMEFHKKGGNLVFDLNNMIVPVENEETGEFELKSFSNGPVSHYYDTSDSLRALYEEWVDMWQDSKK